jgi:hypothetical protein
LGCGHNGHCNRFVTVLCGNSLRLRAKLNLPSRFLKIRLTHHGNLPLLEYALTGTLVQS